MVVVEAFLIALALCVDSLVVSTTSSFRSKMVFRRGLLMAVVFAFFQGLFPLLGALLGAAFKDVVAAVDHWIAFGLLLAVGGKMIWDALFAKEDDKVLDVTSFGTMCVLGIATSIDAFVVGIGFGLDSTLSQTLFTVAVIGVATFIVSLAGWYLGKRNVPVPEKIAGVVAGVVLIGLGVYTLLEHTVL